jgi:hypothetical protein
MGRTTFKELNDLFNRSIRRQINERVNVIRVDKVDPHVNALFAGVAAQVPGQLDGGQLREQRTAIQGRPDEMQPTSAKGMQWHTVPSDSAI